jgi:hypothetical protein
MGSHSSRSFGLSFLAIAAFFVCNHFVRAAEPFEAQLEKDEKGATWLVYPTKPGWHYKLESSPTTATGNFTLIGGKRGLRQKRAKVWFRHGTKYSYS